MEVGELIQQARERAGLTQAALADLLGISAPMLSRIENGHAGLSARHIDVLVDVLDLDDTSTTELRESSFTPGVKLSDLASDLAEVRRGVDEIRAYLGIDDDSE